MELTNFKIYEITDANLRAEFNKKLDIDKEFVQTKPNVWLAEFEADGTKYEAGIRLGHRHDVAPDVEQADTQLRVREQDFDNDTFLSVWKIQEITKLVGEEFKKRYNS
ncbi:MAG TPA: hypothetical protein VNZ03_25955 [Terriglobales bacterium]|jgi:hypothetical protein|nr:hypothetical protein [Terriglobales bacterium]